VHDPFGPCGATQRGGGQSPVERIPSRVPTTLPTSDVSVAMLLPRAGSPPARSPSYAPARRRRRRRTFVRTWTSSMSPHRRGPPRSPARSLWGNARAPISALTPSLVSISRRARASTLWSSVARRSHERFAPAFRSAWYPDSLLALLHRTAHAAAAASRRSRDLRDRASDRVPARSDRSLPRAAFHPRREPGELGHLPSHLAVRHLPPPPRGVAAPSRSADISREMSVGSLSRSRCSRG
jgi:hypothetical protein